MNPEFQRNLWLECTQPRLVSAFAALGALLALAWLLNGRGLGIVTANAGLGCFVLFTLAWGAHLTGESLIQELRSRSWDQQRMSALGPWPMTWGKLLGAPAAAWICGGLCVLVYLLSIEVTADAGWTLLMLGAAAIGLHAFALIGALLLAQRGHQAGAPMSLRIAGGLAALLLANAILNRPDTHVRWFGQDYPALAFSACVVAALAAWVVFGSYRLMCEELKVRTLPWALAGFIGFLAALATGSVVSLTDSPALISGTLAKAGFVCALLAAYLCAFVFAPDPMLPRRLLGYAQRAQWRRVAEESPLWGVGLLYAIGLALVLALNGHPNIALPGSLSRFNGDAGPLLLFATRDLLVFFGIACRAPRRGVEGSQLIYLALAYWLLPAIAHLAGAHSLAGLLRPQTGESLTACVVLLPQVIVAGLWTRRAWAGRMA